MSTKSQTFDFNAINVKLDYDGVLFSFNDAVLSLFNIKKTPEIIEILRKGNSLLDVGITRSQLDEGVADAGDEFWLAEPKLPWANKLFTALSEASKGQISICTSLGSWYASAGPKQKQVEREFGNVPFITCKHKEWVASSRSLLVDDMNYQCEAFRLAGGTSFCWPNQYVLEEHPEQVDIAINSAVEKLKYLNKLEYNGLFQYSIDV